MDLFQDTANGQLVAKTVPTYTLPVMTTSVLGGAKVGNGLTISSEKLAVLKDPNGPVTVSASGVTVQDCGTGQKGVVKIGDGLAVSGGTASVKKDANGPVVVSSSGVSVQDATTGQKGVVKIGSGLSVSGGVVSADAQTPTAGTLISVSGRQVSVKNSFGGNSAPFVGFDASKGELVPASAPTVSVPRYIDFSNLSSNRAWSASKPSESGTAGDVPANVTDTSTGKWRTSTTENVESTINYDHGQTGSSVASILGHIYRALTNKNSNGSDVGYVDANPPSTYHAIDDDYASYKLYDSSSGIRAIAFKTSSLSASTRTFYFRLLNTPTDTTSGNSRRYQVKIEYRGTSASSVAGIYNADITRTATTSGNVTTLSYTGTFKKIGSTVRRLVYTVQTDCFLCLTPTDLDTSCGHCVAASVGGIVMYRYADIFSGLDALTQNGPVLPVKSGTQVVLGFYEMDISSTTGGGSLATINYSQIDYLDTRVSFVIHECRLKA